MEVEALEVCLTRPPGGGPRCIRLAPELEDGGTGPRAQREHRTGELAVPREEVSEAMRQREDPLAHGHPRQHLVHEVRRLLAHASTAAAGAEPAPLAGERHESFVSAVAAAHPREAARK